MIRRLATILAAGALALAVTAPAGAVTRPAGASSGPRDPVKLNVLFIGAHPDDEAGEIAAFGTWSEQAGLRAGVITITRGEGGGNAVGPETGPALGIIREAEERRAVGKAGITDIFYLDAVDFYYTVSSPLTEQLWGHDAVLGRIVRIIRETRPDVIITMNPSPAPGNHGNHQFAARLAVEAYNAAADRTQFADQLTSGGLKAWAVKRIFMPTGGFFAPPFGPDCAAHLPPDTAGGNVFGVWDGYPSARNGGTRWLQLMFDAFGEYKTQGFPSGLTAPADPSFIPCSQFLQIASRVPFGKASSAVTNIFEGASVPAPPAVPGTKSLPLGTLLYLTSGQFDVVAGQSFTVVAHARAGGGAFARPTVSLQLPDGWTARGSGALGAVTSSTERTASFTVTPAAGAAQGRYQVGAVLRAGADSGYTNVAVALVPAAEGSVQRLPQVAEFERWAVSAGVPQLGGLVKPVLPIGVGETRSVSVDVHNWSNSTQAGDVSLTLPAGFAASPASRTYAGLAAGASSTVSFDVTNTNPGLPTANQGGTNGDYDVTLGTTTSAGAGSETFGLDLVPRTTIPKAAAAPVLDGVATPGEYAGPALDIGRLWEGNPCSPDGVDCGTGSTARVTWYGDNLYFFVHVVDDVLGAAVTPANCVAHWRTDSVEITLDPRGSSENTGTTFKTGIFPVTNDPAHGNGPCWERDADNHQGPGAATAPGMEVVSHVTSPYTGYDLEVKIPLADLPAAVGPTDPTSAVDPAHLGLNVLVYDSDTQDLQGQTRLAWSPYGGVQGDPYRWGHADLAGYVPPAGRSTTPPAPVVPDTAALGVDSPQSILMSAQDGVPLSGYAAAPASDRLLVTSLPTLGATSVQVTLQATGAGRAHLFAWTGTASVADLVVQLTAGRPRTVSLSIPAAAHAALAAGGTLVVSFAAAAGGTQSLALPLK